MAIMMFHPSGSLTGINLRLTASDRFSQLGCGSVRQCTTKRALHWMENVHFKHSVRLNVKMLKPLNNKTGSS